MWGWTMLYTGNANRILFWVVIPLVLLSYLAFKFAEWKYISEVQMSTANNAHEHFLNTKANSKINCLILGGSNSVLSLSADLISSTTELQCYNLSLRDEGNNYQAYWNFIQSLSLDNNQIKYVFYSGLTPLMDDDFYLDKLKKAELNIDLEGDQSFRLFGSSIAYYLANLLKGKKLFDIPTYPLPNRFGDFDFSKFSYCGSDIVMSTDGLYWQDLNLLRDWSSSQLKKIKLLFPNTNIYFVIPSVLHGEKFNKLENEKVIKTLDSIISNFDNSPNKIKLIVQTPFSDKSILCDADHHTNTEGRMIRTRNLIEHFNRVNIE